MHYYQHHIGDFIRDTSRLSDAQAMAYLRLLWIYYESEKPLPDNPSMLAMKIGSDSDTVSMILSAFFTVSDAVWIQMRCESEIRKYHGKAEGARKANRARWSNSDMKSDMKSDTFSDRNQEPITNNQEPITKKPKNTATIVAAPDGVSQSVWTDFLQLRKAKKAPVTQSAVEGIKREALKAGWTLNAALQECCSRGWAGFKAEWAAEKSRQVESFRERDERQARERFEEATGRRVIGDVIDITPVATMERIA